jgi:hypothetical protein
MKISVGVSKERLGILTFETKNAKNEFFIKKQGDTYSNEKETLQT